MSAERINDSVDELMRRINEKAEKWEEKICPSCKKEIMVQKAAPPTLCPECECPLAASAEEAREHARKRELKAREWRAKRWEAEISQRLGIPARYCRAKMEDLSKAVQEKILHAFADKRWPYLVGPCGTGKTHALAAIMRHVHLESEKQESEMINIPDLIGVTKEAMDDKREMMDGSRNSPELVIRRFASIPFLALDDFGTERDTPWGMEVVARILDKRYAGMKMTAISSNLARKAISNERVVSRFVECAEFIALTSVRPERGGKR